MTSTGAQRQRVAVVGLGIGAAHADAFARLPDAFEVVAVADPDQERVDFVRSFVDADGATSLDDVLARDDVDIVSLATPPFLHFDQIRTALHSGRHVVCEKPVVGSLADVDALRALERDTERWVMPIFQYRYGRGLQKLVHLVESGIAGRCHTVAIDVSWRRRDDYYAVPWRGAWATELGGLLTSHCVHAIDMATLVAGHPTQVFARTSTRINPIETEDCASVSLALPDGGFATLSATLGSAAEITGHRLVFERMSAESNTAAYENHRDPWTFVGDDADAQAEIDAALDAFVDRSEKYKGQFARLADALAVGAPPPVTLADARASLEILTAAYRSAATGRDVALPIGTDAPDYRGWQGSADRPGPAEQ